jgi:hypothetical protein
MDGLIIVNYIIFYKIPLPRRKFPLHFVERVRVRQGEGGTPSLQLTPTRGGRIIVSFAIDYISAVWPCTFSSLPVKCLTLPPSSRGLGHQPFKLKIRGSNPLGGIIVQVFGYFLRISSDFSPFPGTFTNKRHEIAATQVFYFVSFPQFGDSE